MTSVAATAPLWLPLDAAEATIELVGGKGASLGRMAAAGLPVPPGFHVTTASYHRFLKANGLREAIAEAADGAVADNLGGLERASATIQQRFQQAAVPDAVGAAVSEAYATLGPDEPVVAVRSSSTAEDLAGFSFAGQQESYLNVRGEAAVLDGTRCCWASLWTSRALAYRLRMRIDQGVVAMGVVVQLMVPSEVSGVLFTANPTTGSRDELVVEASFGLGEAVVSGLVTPDSYTLDKGSRALKEAAFGQKQVMITPAPGHGTIRVPVPEERQAAWALSERSLRHLAELAMQVERGFGGVPQDIEWAMTGEHCWLLQARPMTGPPPAPLRPVD
jgi:rifampicin phosphotransferase